MSEDKSGGPIIPEVKSDDPAKAAEVVPGVVKATPVAEANGGKWMAGDDGSGRDKGRT